MSGVVAGSASMYVPKELPSQKKEVRTLEKAVSETLAVSVGSETYATSNRAVGEYNNKY